MVTLNNTNFNIFNQRQYEKLISSQEYMNISCSCGSKGNYVVHAYYYRCIKAPFFKLRLRILRVRCLICGKTHAVLPIGIVPYSQVPLLTQLNIIKVIGTTSSLKKILAHHPELDESDIYRICSRYMTHWRERLRSSLLDIVSLLETPLKLVQFCFSEFKRNFMQIKRTYNSIGSYNHIS